MDSKLIPCDEGLAREIVAGLQGVVFSKGIDAKTVPLENVFAPVNYARGIRMRCATKGPGRHDPWMPNDSIDVPAGEVYVTLDTRGFTGGSLTTYGLQNKGDRLVLASQKEHARS